MIHNVLFYTGNKPTNYTLQCRTRNGTASLCGFSEQTGHESIPPKKYRVLTGSGSVYRCIYNDSNCSSPAGVSDGWIISGSASYNKNTCELTDSSTANLLSGSGCPTSNVIGSFSLVDDWNSSPPNIIGDLVAYPQITTSTSVTQTGIGVCFTFHDSSFGIPFGSASLIVSDEDIESDAINRLFPNPNAGWTSFSAPSANGCCTASYVLRNSGDFSFAITQSQFQLSGSGLTPNARFTIPISIYRRILGSSDPYILYETLVYNTTTTDSGTFQVVDFVPNDPGFQTYAGVAGTCSSGGSGSGGGPES